MNNFQKDLEFSQNPENEDLWYHIYKTKFPNMIACISTSGILAWQEMGVDRIIILDKEDRVGFKGI